MMKKIGGLLLCLVLLCSTCYAEVDFNVEDYTDDELIEIMKAIYESNTQLGYLYTSSVLKVGEDIPAGEYEFWVEESDITFDSEGQPTYHCGANTLCHIIWGNEYDEYSWENTAEIYYDEYNDPVNVKLEEGQYLWTKEAKGRNYTGLRMKYFPNRQSGLFAE